MPVTLADKLKSIGVSNAFAKRALDGKLPPAQKAILGTLLISGMREAFAIRAVERGLSTDDIEWNRRLGRPIGFVEGDKDVEAQRRADWTRRHPGP